MAAGDIYSAKQGGMFERNGQRFFIKPGATVRAGHWLLAEHAELFEPLRVDFEVTKAAEPKREPAEHQDDPKAAEKPAQHRGARTR